MLILKTSFHSSGKVHNPGLGSCHTRGWAEWHRRWCRGGWSWTLTPAVCCNVKFKAWSESPRGLEAALPDWRSSSFSDWFSTQALADVSDVSTGTNTGFFSDGDDGNEILEMEVELSLSNAESFWWCWWENTCHLAFSNQGRMTRRRMAVGSSLFAWVMVDITTSLCASASRFHLRFLPCCEPRELWMVAVNRQSRDGQEFFGDDATIPAERSSSTKFWIWWMFSIASPGWQLNFGLKIPASV